MRKFLAALLAVMMLASVLTVAVGAEASTFDKSVKTDADGLDLIVTEVMVDSVSGIDGYQDSDAFEYIELYNRGSEPVDLSQLCILMSNNEGIRENNNWLSTHKFTHKVNLMSGDVYNDEALAAAIRTNHSNAWEVNNPSSCMLAPGAFALIWVWTNDCNTISEYLNESLAAPDSTRPGVFFPKFRDFFATEEGGNGLAVPDDMLVMVAMGATTIAGNTAANPAGFNLANSGNRMYAIAEKGFDTNADSALTATGALNPKIKCLFQWGYNNKSGIPQVAAPQLSTIYAPTDAEPYIFNRDQVLNQEEGKTPQSFTDYAEKDASLNYEVSYNEMSVMTYWEDPTPGYMMPYQWIYIQKDETKIPESAKKYTYDGNEDGILTKTDAVNPNWRADALAALEKAKIIVGDDVTSDETSRGEVIYPDRDNLGNFQIVNQNKPKEEKGLPTFALILIIVGGVLVVAAIAVVVIIIIKKKNKPVAADDVAAEGEVEIIDESAEGEAPAANEAPEEKTPSDESKPE